MEISEGRIMLLAAKDVKFMLKCGICKFSVLAKIKR